MDIYGLTGGIGSGKSAAARRFTERGVPAIEADAVGHDLLEPGGAAVEPVFSVFGAAVLAEEDGSIDRTKLAELVFHDASARARLNGIIHPMILREVARQCAECAAQGARAALVDAALLAEHGHREPWLKGLILVLCPTEIRVQRLVSQRGLSEEDARRRIAAQVPPESKVTLADWVLDNTGKLADLHDQIDRVALEILMRASVGVQ